MSENVRPLRQPAPTDVPAMGLSYQFQVVDGISLVFQTHLQQDSHRQDIDELLDRVAGAAERQKAKIELPEIRRRLEKAVGLLEIAERDYVTSKGRFEGMAANSNRREQRITAHQQTELDNAKVSLERLQQEITNWEGEIAKREAVVYAKADA